MAWRNWRRVLELGWAMGPACHLCLGCGRGEPLGTPTAIAMREPGDGLFGPPSQSAPLEVAAVDEQEQPPIYDEQADGKKLIEAAVNHARLGGTHVLIEWGGNSCGWCYKLHDVFQQDELIQPIVSEEYQLVLVDAVANEELMRATSARRPACRFRI